MTFEFDSVALGSDSLSRFFSISFKRLRSFLLNDDDDDDSDDIDEHADKDETDDDDSDDE